MASDTPEVSVVVCTRDRARSLARCLSAVGRQRAAPAFEVVVVDNGSSDDTAARMAELIGRDTRLRMVREPRTGVARARNCGAAAARAPLLAYLDDDTEPDPGWLAALVGTLRDAGSAAVGGPIRARFEAPPPPAWLTPVHLEALACLDLGGERRRVTAFPYLFTANLALRRADLERLGGFDERLGRKGRSLLSGEDTDLCERIRGAGGDLWYEPRAAVDHWLPPERLTRAYFRRRALYTGRTRALQVEIRAGRGAVAVSAAAKLLKLPAHLALWGVALAARRHRSSAVRARNAMATLGFVSHLWRREDSNSIASGQ